MHIFRWLIVGLALIALTSACAANPDRERGRVLCPACGSEFDALFQKHF